MKKFYYILLNFLFLVSSLFAENELPEIKQYTSHPGRDFAPAISSDGKWMAFVSERSGNLDVWIKGLPNGRALQVTEHPAEDYQPSWSHDGHKLLFVSKRQDADGDIWTIRVDPGFFQLSKGKPKQVTKRLGSEMNPSFSPSDDKIIFTERSDTLSNLFVYSLKKKKKQQLTFRGGFNAAWHPEKDLIVFSSYRDDKNGDLYLIDNKHSTNVIPIVQSQAIEDNAKWSADGKGFVFVRWAEDTNFDGWITPSDHGSIWINWLGENWHEQILPSTEQQLTTYYYHDNTPVLPVDGRIYFASDRSGGDDIWSIPQLGIMPEANTAKNYFMDVSDRFGLSITPEALYQANLAYHNGLQFYPNEPIWAVRSLLNIAENQRVLGKMFACEATLTRILNEYPDEELGTAYAQLKLATLDHIPIAQRIALCQNLVKASYSNPRIIPQTYLILGGLYEQIRQNDQSFIAYTQAVEYSGSQQNLKAQALLEIGDYYERDEQFENAKQYYLSILREYGDVPLWRQRANQRLLSQVEGDSRDKIQGFQDFFIYSADLPATVARAQLEICQILMHEKQYVQALQELEYIEQLVPSEKWAHVESILLQANVYHRTNDDLKAILMLEQIPQKYALVEGGRYVETAQEQLFDILLKSADRIKQQKDYDLASSRYHKAIEIHPDNVDAHRGWIESDYYRGNINPIIENYKKLLITRSEDPVVLYCLGLAYSYKAEAIKSAELVKTSNQYLK